MNMAVHGTGSTGVTPYVAFFARHPPRTITAPLVTVPLGENETQKLKLLIKEASVQSQRRYRKGANRKCKAEKVHVSASVWVKSETLLPGNCAKLNAKWKGPYRVIEIIRNGQVYMLEDPYSGKCVQRAADKIKQYISRHEIIPEVKEVVDHDSLKEEEEDQGRPPRHRQPPRRYIEEC